jgi:hypothetical protein
MAPTVEVIRIDDAAIEPLQRRDDQMRQDEHQFDDNPLGVVRQNEINWLRDARISRGD